MKRHLTFSTSAIVVLSFFAAMLLPNEASAQTPHDLFQQAKRLETSQGDLESAITLYQQILEASGGDRDLSARALLRMGQAYETLGQTGATNAYRQIVRDYSDQTDTAKLAQKRLDSLVQGGKSSPPGNRLVLIPGEVSQIPFHGDRGNNKYDGVDMSPDGLYLVFVTGDEAFIQEIETGNNIDISLAPDRCASTGMKFSPDGKNIAYGCWGGGIGIYNRRADRSRQILDAQEYFGLSEDDFIEMEVFDWTTGGDSLMVSVWGLPPEVSDHMHQLLFVPVDGGSPRTVESSNDSAGHFMRDTVACLMRNDRFLFGEWWRGNEDIERYRFYIQRISTIESKREKVLYDTSSDFKLFGCDKDRNILYYEVEFPAMRPTLWAAFVEEDGSLSRKQFLADLPSSAWAHPITQDGNLYYTIRLLDGDYWHGRLTDSGAQYLGKGQAWTLDWTDDGRFRADATGTSEISIIDSRTSEVRRIDTGHWSWSLAWFPDRERFLASYWPNGERASLQFTRSWIHDANSGVVIDSLDGVRAFATSADGESVYFPEVTDSGVCVTSMRLADRFRTHLRCFPEATGVPQTFNAWEMSRSRNLIWLHYSVADSTNIYRIVSLDDSVDYVLREGELNRNIEFLPDDSGAIIIERSSLFFFDMATGIETEVSSGLPQNMFHQFYGWKLHPDGIRFDARLGISQQAKSDLMVINNVVGLFDSEK